MKKEKYLKTPLLGNFLKRARLRRGLSQRDLARYFRLRSAQSISNIERGQSPLPSYMLPELVKLLKLNKRIFLHVLIKDAEKKYREAFRKN